MAGRLMAGGRKAPRERDTAAAIAPEEVRAIRERLGLTQAEASELLGGGPRAFTKYEAGTVKPAAAVVTLLRLLEHDPATLRSLQASKSLPMSPMPERASPFRIGGEDVARLSADQWPQLLRRLLHTEALAYSLPRDGIHVAGDVNAPDGGEDGRIEWQGGNERTAFLPCRVNQFQLKSGEVKPRAAGRDILQGGRLKAQIRDVLEAGGHYRMLCGHRYTKKAVLSREQSIREAIRGAGVAVNGGQVSFWDADQVAEWANAHPAVSVWVKEQTQPGTVGPFRSWAHWARHSDHSLPWVEDERLPLLRDRLREAAMSPQRVLRIVGLSGIGKSRLVIEGLGPGNGDCAVSDIVLYANEDDVHKKDIRHVVETLAANGTHALVVVNRCNPETHRALVGQVSRSISRLSLVTLDDEIPTTVLDETTVKVEPAPDAVVEAIVDRTVPNLQPEERRLLVHFSKGFPRIAIDVANAWRSERPIAHAAADDIVDAFVLGRLPHDREVARKSAMLVAAFGAIAVEPEQGQLEKVASFRHDLTADDLRIGVDRLVGRGSVRRRGRLRVVQPRPIAMRLAEQQWRDWSGLQWERALTGDHRLGVSAARVLAHLNTTPVAEQVVRHVCRRGGPFDGMKELRGPSRPDVLGTLAAVAPAVVLEVMERALNKESDLCRIDSVRGHIVWALEQIAFHAATFERAAELLLRLAATETENFANNATGIFVGLFRTYLGNTEADGDARLALFDSLWDTADAIRRAILVEALTRALDPRAIRLRGAETQGTRPALSSWLPNSRETESKYVTGCVLRLANVACECGTDPVILEHAKSGLGKELHALLRWGYIDAVEQTIRQVAPVVGHWPAAAESVGNFLAYDAEAVDPQTTQRLRELLAALQPADTLGSRIHHLVTAMPRDFPLGEKLDVDERHQQQVNAIKKLADDLAKAPEELAKSLPALSQGGQMNAGFFGELLGERTDVFTPDTWLERIERAAIKAPETDRDLSLLCGYYIGVAKAHPDMAPSLKQRLAVSSTLARELPFMCARLDVRPSDIDLAVRALQSGLLLPAQLHIWGGALRKLSPHEVAPLFDALLETDALSTVLDLLYTYGMPESLDYLRPQIRKCVRKYVAGGELRLGPPSSHQLEGLMKWVLGKGRKDADACEIALDLAKFLVASSHRGDVELPASIACRLLSDFPEVVWPYIGAAIVSDAKQEWLLALVLGRKYANGTSAILSLPEPTLLAWCHAHPDQAPAFAATAIPTLKKGEDRPVLHPTLRRVVDEFGERADVLRGIESNIGTYNWVGSMVPYYEQFTEPIRELTDHRTPAVRRWARRMTRVLQSKIEDARDEDAEFDVEWGN